MKVSKRKQADEALQTPQSPASEVQSIARDQAPDAAAEAPAPEPTIPEGKLEDYGTGGVFVAVGGGKRVRVAD